MRRGCRRPMLSVLTGDPAEIADELLTSADVDLVTFTGGVSIGKYIAGKAVYKRQVLELGGNDPIIVLEDADLEEAAALAASGSYANSGQRCTAVKRMLVQEKRCRPLRRASGREDARRSSTGIPSMLPWTWER
jgi:acyl-CoA reductase-like NAD-dependent aldehyde dehydrogenase